MSVKTMQTRSPDRAISRSGGEPMGWASASAIAPSTSASGSVGCDTSTVPRMPGGNSNSISVLL
jgi:hypothetical protein